MLRFLLVGIFLIVMPSIATAQSGLQTAMFILSNGSLDIDQLIEKDGKIVVRDHAYENTYRLRSEAKHCSLEVESASLSNKAVVHKSVTLFSNIIREEIKYEETIRGPRIYFIGQADISCFQGHAEKPECSKTMIITPLAANSDRMIKAINYLFDNHCRAAKRTSAF